VWQDPTCYAGCLISNVKVCYMYCLDIDIKKPNGDKWDSPQLFHIITTAVEVFVQIVLCV